MHKTIRPGKIQMWKPSGPQWRSFFCKIDYESGNLSISGVIDPWTSGNAGGSCGQIAIEFAHRNPEDNDSRYANSLIKPDDIQFAPGWNADSWLDFLDIWKRWHLNDMNAACVHQRQLPEFKSREIELGTGRKRNNWVYPSEHPDGILCRPCPICGYKYGSAWLCEEVPQDVIDFLIALPDTDVTPAWV